LPSSYFPVSLFYCDATSYIIQGRMMWWVTKVLEAVVAQSRYYPSISFQELKKTTRHCSQDTRCASWDWNWTRIFIYSLMAYLTTGTRGSVVGWGIMLPAGKSRVRLPIKLADFLIYQILPAALWPWARLNL
jgi:hypothetical protein